MFNSEENGILWRNIGKGILWGIGLVIAMAIWTTFADTWNCMCEETSAGCMLPEFNSEISYIFVFVISVVIGIIAGIGTAIDARKARIAVETKNRQVSNRKFLLERLGDMVNLSEKKADVINNYIPTSEYVEMDIREEMPPLVKQCEAQYKQVEEIVESYRV